MKEGLSLYESNITNEDIVVTYTPSSYAINYSYKIIKNNIPGEVISIDNKEPVTITLNKTGTYKIEITETNYYNQNIITSGEYKIDKEAPIINIKEKTYKMNTSEEFNMDNISASDAIDGDLTSKITNNISTIDFTKEGVKNVEYTVVDSAGNTAKEIVYVTVKKDNTDLIRTGQLSILLIFILIILFIFKYIRSIKLEKRFSKYTINSSKNKSISLFDNLYMQYIEFIDKLSNILSKSNYFKKSSLKYNKYIYAFKDNIDNPIKIVARKIVYAFTFIGITIIANLAHSKATELHEMIIPFILGYYTLDVLYGYKYINYKKKIENDMLEAITVMNNAFKSGKSIIQAIDLVSNELDGPIAKEFKKIAMEINLGLDVEVAFKRFAKRVKIKEAMYLTSSLSVLNKTGGNIIKVFDSIEKNLFNRKKLQAELKSLTSSSKLIMYVLIVVPIAFVLFISIINIGYFKPLFTSPLGLILIGIMVMIYITYIFAVTKVLKVRM